MKKITFLFLVVSISCLAQVGISTTNPHVSSELEIASTSRGLLIPRLTTSAIVALSATASEGLMVFDTTLKQFLGFDGSSWQVLGTVRTVVFAGWEVNGITGYGGASAFSATTINQITSANLARGSGLLSTPAGGAAANAWGGIGFDASVDAASAVINNDYFTFTLVLPSSSTFSFTKIPTFNYRRPASGPQYLQWQYSVNGGAFINVGAASNQMTDTGANGNIIAETILSSVADLQNLTNATVVFRLVGYGGTGGAGYINNANILNDIEIMGTYY